MALKTFLFPTFEEWRKTKHVTLNLGDYSAQISHLKTHNQDDFIVEMFLASVYCKTSNNPVVENIDSTTFVYIPQQFTEDEFKAAYNDACEFLNKTFKKHMYRTYWE